MTSKPSLTNTPKPSPTLADAISDALTSRQYNDALGATVNVNITDGLFAIANAINRLAATHEHGQERADRMYTQFEAMTLDGDDPAVGNA
jgi:hypothetical protein